MDVVNNWQALERLSRAHIATLLAEAYFRRAERGVAYFRRAERGVAYFRGVSRVASFRGDSRVAEQNRRLRRRIARWLKKWAEKLESEPCWVREGKASYG